MIALDLANYIQGLGLGTVGVNLFVGHLPSTPDTAMALTSYGGPAGDGGKGYDNPTVQLRSRAMSNQAAYDQAMAIYAALVSLSNTQLGLRRLVNCQGIQSEPVSLGRDEAGREEYTLNFQLRVRNKTVNRE